MDSKRHRLLQKLIRHGKLKGEEVKEARAFIKEAPEATIDNIRSNLSELENTIKIIRSLVKHFPQREEAIKTTYRPPLKVKKKLLDKTFFLGDGIYFEIIDLDNTQFVARFLKEDDEDQEIRIYNAKYALGKKALREGAKNYLFYIRTPYPAKYQDYLWLTSKNSYLPDLFKKYSVGKDGIVVYTTYALPYYELALILEYYLNELGKDRDFEVYKIEEY